MPKPSRKRRIPVRYNNTEENQADQGLGEPSEDRATTSRQGNDSPSVEVVQQEQPTLNNQPAVVEESEPSDPSVRTRVKVRKDNSGLAYRLLRRSICTLTSKINELTKEVELTKLANSGASDLSNETQENNNSGPSNESVENLGTNEMAAGSHEPNPIIHTPEGSTQNKSELKNGENVDYKQVIYNIRNISIERPKFEGVGASHPVTFMEELETYLKKSVKEGQNEIDLILECLKGDARDWARIYCKRWVGLNDFKKDFFSTYWGEKEQNELRRNIVYGSWNRQSEPSMLNYFLRIIGKAQMLSHQIPENQLVSDVIRHYPKHIQQVWFTLQKQSVIEAAEFLRSMDEINKQEPHVYSSGGAKNPPRNNLEQKRNEIKQNYRNWQRPATATKPTGVNVVSAEEIAVSALESQVEALN
ncbi:hypothetical protein NE865_00691 [Phthorimaea operculella]|nr:hypothetical protein NE865_00691 [Phthorimaea operculella]